MSYFASFPDILSYFIVERDSANMLPLSKPAVNLVQLHSRNNASIVTAAISHDGTRFAYADMKKIRFFKLTVDVSVSAIITSNWLRKLYLIVIVQYSLNPSSLPIHFPSLPPNPLKIYA